MPTTNQLLQQLSDLKQQRDAYKLSQTALDNQYERSRTMLTYSSNALEGNTLSHLETSLIINEHISVAGKKLVEIQEATNHAEAVDYIKQLAKNITIHNISQEHIQQIHQSILHNINDVYAGMYRDVPVRIAGSRTVLPNYTKVLQLMQDLEKWIQSVNDHPCLIASELHYRFVTIHPFVDGNGRTARLLANLVLLINGYPMMIIPPEDRQQYLNALEVRQTGGDEEQYHELMLGYIKDSLQEQIDFYSS